MASSTGHPGAVSRETYWKRRALVLAGVMLALTLIAFACRPSSGDDAEPTRAEAGAADSDPTPSVPPATPSADESGEPEDDPSEGEDEDSEGSDPSEDEEGRDSAGGGGGEGADAESGGAAAPESPEDACRPEDVVVSFAFADEDREVYGSGAEPGFRVTVVNTGNQTCTVDMGAEAMEIRIHSGDDRIFSTTDCVEGEAADARQVSRGVPEEFTFGWDRQRSFTDCRDSSAARPGWYRANLHGEYAGDTGELVFQLT